MYFGGNAKLICKKRRNDYPATFFSAESASIEAGTANIEAFRLGDAIGSPSHDED